MVFDERLRVPVRWWALATAFLFSVLVAFLVATPAWVALLSTGVLVAVVVLVLAGWGSARVAVDHDRFVAGRAQIPVRLLGPPVALDREGTRRLAGVDADARAYLLLRPYLERAVRVPLCDPDDPTPYWLVATRRPDALAAAVERCRHPLPDPG